MNVSRERLLSRALHAEDVRGHLPASKSLTPAELAREAARRGDDRLARLVTDWYYPASYGHTTGSLSEREAIAIVEALEEAASASKPRQSTQAPAPVAVEVRQTRTPTRCDLCGEPLPSALGAMFQTPAPTSKINP